MIFSCTVSAVEHGVECRCRNWETYAAKPLGRTLEGTHHFAPDRVVDVRHISIEVTPDFDRRTIHAIAKITAKPITKAIRSLELDAVHLNVKSVQCDQSAVREFLSTQEGLLVRLDKEIAAGQEFTITVDYEAEPKAGFYFRTPEMGYPATDSHIWTQGEAHEARHWFPCFDYPNEKSTSEIICHVPDSMTVLSNGRKISEETTSNGLRRVHWKMDKPHVSYLICLVAGDLEHLAAQHGDVPLGFYSQPSIAQHAANSFQDTVSIMSFFEREIGRPFPWPKYDQVTIADFTAGGMENTTLTTLTENTVYSVETESIHSSHSLDAHEMAHQWFGDFVTCKDWSHLWLNEGFATYYAALYDGEKNGRDALLYELYKDQQTIALVKEDKRPIVYNGYQNAMEQFDYRTYPKGGWVLHMLRSDLGDELYRKCIASYLDKHALQTVVSDDLRAVLEEHSGKSYDRFFDQWLYHGQIPRLKIDYAWDVDGSQAKLTIRQTQEISADVRLFDFETTLRFWINGEAQDRKIHVSREQEDYYFSFDSAPSLVRFDPEFTLLCDAEFDKSDDMWFAQLANMSDVIGRLLACQALKGRNHRESVERLTKVLHDDPFFGVRIAAADALGQMNTPEADSALIAAMAAQQDARVRLAIVNQLGKGYSNQLPRELLTMLESETNPAIQREIVVALSKYPSHDVQNAVRTALSSASFRDELADGAITALANFADPNNCEVLRATIVERQGTWRTHTLSHALKVYGTLSSLQSEKQSAYEFLLEYVTHPKEVVRTSAIEAIGNLKYPTSIVVLEALSETNDERLKSAADEAIRKTRDVTPVIPSEIAEMRNKIDSLEEKNRELQKQIDSVLEKVNSKKE